MAIERSQGRIRGPQRWGPRTLDLDLLVCGDTMVCDHILTLPHPGMLERNFVLYPLVEIAPELVLPGGVALAAALQKCSQDGLEIVE